MKLRFIITYQRTFKTIRNILQELHTLLTPDQEHKKIFEDIPFVGFPNGKNFKNIFR